MGAEPFKNKTPALFFSFQLEIFILEKNIWISDENCFIFLTTYMI